MLRVPAALVYLLLSICSVPLQGAVLPEERQPNILLLLADDLGYNDSGIYQDVYRQTPVSTMPALESLAREGVRFSRFYTESTCSASRIALLTGQYPARHGFIPVGRGISPDVVTLPEYLRSRGYITHHVGKWHAGEIHREAYPAKQGFDSSFGFLSQWMLQGPAADGKIQLKAPTYLNPWLVDEEGRYRHYQGHLEDLLTEHTVRLIQQHDSQPWFIYHAFMAPHTPLQPAERFAQRFANTKEGKYQAMLAQLDDSLRQIFSALKKTGQWDNTVIIIASDNGSSANIANSNAPFTGGKASYDEGGIRTPLIIKWHKAYADVHGAGEKKLRSDVVSIMDIYASLQALLGETHSETLLPLDGKPALLPVTDKYHAASAGYFYSFDAMSVFNTAFDRRLIREWDGENFTRSELVRYDAKGLETSFIRSFWSGFFTDSVAEEDILFKKFLQWLNDVRQVPLKIKVSGSEKHDGYEISGNDFLRTPVNPAFAVSFDFMAEDINRRQVLLFQPGIMELMLENGRLHGNIHNLKVEADAIKAGACYSIVLSGEFYDRYSTIHENIRISRLHLIINGEIRSKAEARIENLSDIDVGVHTYAGWRPDRNPETFYGRLSKPLFFVTQLLPADRPLPSHFYEVNHGFCPLAVPKQDFIP